MNISLNSRVCGTRATKRIPELRRALHQLPARVTQWEHLLPSRVFLWCNVSQFKANEFALEMKMLGIEAFESPIKQLPLSLDICMYVCTYIYMYILCICISRSRSRSGSGSSSCSFSPKLSLSIFSLFSDRKLFVLSLRVVGWTCRRRRRGLFSAYSLNLGPFFIFFTSYL